MANKAAWLTSANERPFKIDDAPLPEPKPNEVIVRNHAVAINPVDWAMQNMVGFPLEYPFIEGCDAAGEITAVGSAIKNFKIGDRVIAITDSLGSKSVSNAAFQLFFSAGEGGLAKIPDHVSYVDASVLPLGISTAASGLFQSDTLALPLPRIDAKPTGKVVLVWGGSSSMGSCAIQLVVGAGFDVATTAGSKNLEYCKSLGAKYAFDHTKEDVVEEITTALKGVDFAGVFCAIMVPDVIKQCAQIASKLGGNKFVSTVLASTMPLQDGLPEDVKTSNGEMVPSCTRLR